MRGVRIVLLFLSLGFAACTQGNYEGYKYKPYSVRGVTYYPMAPEVTPGYVEEGIASHYTEGWLVFPGKNSLGEKMWPWTSTAAHKTLPIPCLVEVKNLSNGRTAIVRVSDRGPFIPGRTLDVTEPVAKKLGFHQQGLTQVRIRVLSVGEGRSKLTRPIPRALSVQQDGEAVGGFYR